MDTREKQQTSSIAERIRQQILSGGERYWRLRDFPDLPPGAVVQTLSRLARSGKLRRVSKGLYWRPRETAFGPSLPKADQLRSLLLEGRHIFPSGISAANLLGFTTQNPARIEIATTETSLPQEALEEGTILHTRRPHSRRLLSQYEAALLEFLRDRAQTSELTLEQTISKLLEHLRSQVQFEKLLRVAKDELPRVRAMLGALGQQLGYKKEDLTPLSESLKPLSRFDFGILAALPYAKQWQAKECQGHETL